MSFDFLVLWGITVLLFCCANVLLSYSLAVLLSYFYAALLICWLDGL
jgi:hypothetical protein